MTLRVKNIHEFAVLIVDMCVTLESMWKVDELENPVIGRSGTVEVTLRDQLRTIRSYAEDICRFAKDAEV